jgi:hypothetical protein
MSPPIRSFAELHRRRFDSVIVSPAALAYYDMLANSIPGLSLDGKRLDAGETAFFARMLEHIKAQTYDVKYLDLQARNLIPVHNDTPTGAESVTWRQYDEQATAKIIGNYANDFERATIVGAESTPVQVRSIANAYGYSVQELRAAMFAGVDLDTKKANAARRAIEQQIDSIACLGDSDYSLAGFAKLSAVNIATLPTGTWSSASASNMLADMLYMVQQLAYQSNGLHEATDLVLPALAWRRAHTTHFSTDASRTVAAAFKEVHPEVKLTRWPRLSTASASSGERILCYQRSPDNAWLEIPQDFEQFPPQVRGLQTEIICHARTAGVICPYPLSVLYADNS